MRHFPTLTGAALTGLAIACAICGIPEEPRTARSLDPQLGATKPVAAILSRACADCHSETTRWPWYAHVPLVGSSLRSDVTNARTVLNFSRWRERRAEYGAGADAILSAACADMRSGRMPLGRYRWMHRDARLNSGEIDTFCGWAEQRVQQSRSHKSEFTFFSQYPHL